MTEGRGHLDGASRAKGSLPNYYGYGYSVSEIKRQRGRPPKSPEGRRGKSLRIMLTEAEREALDEAASGEAGTSTWARRVLLMAARRAGTGRSVAGGD